MRLAVEGEDLELYDLIDEDRNENRLEELKARLLSGLDPNHQSQFFDQVGSRWYKPTLLEQALYWGSADCVKMLLEAKADVNGRRALMNDGSRHHVSLLSCCHNDAQANLLIRAGLKLKRCEYGISGPNDWPRLPDQFFEDRKAYYALHARKDRCRQACMILLHRRVLAGMPMDLRRDWIKRMIWSTQWDSVWAPQRGGADQLPAAFEVDTRVPPPKLFL